MTERETVTTAHGDTSGMLIIGAGLAGLTVAETLRAEGYTGPITLIGDEVHAPYQRPPLSKAFLLSDTTEAQLMMRPAEIMAKKSIELKLGAGVTAIDRARKQVTLSDDSTLTYDGLALCTGSRLRTLPLTGADWRGVFGLRSLDDSKGIKDALETAQNVVIIGGGFIGLEVAAVARKKGKKVTVLEAADRLMARVVAPLISQFYLDLHTANGVEVVLGAMVSELVGHDNTISAVKTKDGREFAADLALVGIGVIPNTELAEAAGLEVDGGIVVDVCGRTADPTIVSAGDCTALRMDNGSLRRLESVQNALEQGKSAAAGLLGRERPFNAAPWFWSDQYDVKLQMLGLTAGFDNVVTRGDPGAKKFSAYYFKNGNLIAIDSLNQAAEHMNGRKLFDKCISLTPEQAADTAFDLNSLLV
ncbi:MAG: FAD-dependent oxidoreductase [Sulfuritalea sp.]|nr:FAD-dependent oxidoreductase [Sulfuritalea sp.]